MPRSSRRSAVPRRPRARAPLRRVGAILLVALAAVAIGRQSPSASDVAAPSAAPESTAAESTTLLMRDGTIYELSSAEVRDSMLQATGTGTVEGKTAPIDTTLKASDVDFVQAHREWSKGKRLLAFGAVVTFIAISLPSLQGSSALTLEEIRGYYTPPVISSSCPFVYSYDGHRYHRESETVAGAVFKGAERVSYDALVHLRPVRDTYRLKVTNESDETQFLDELKLLLVDAPRGVQVIPDTWGAMHAISTPIAPTRCVDFGGHDALAAILRDDDRRWESDMTGKDFSRDDALRDGLVVEFPLPPGASQAKLVVEGINTQLGVFAFHQLFGLSGDSLLVWYQRLDNDLNERMKLINWMMREGMLHLSVWQNDHWVAQTPLLDVGPAVEKQQVAILDVSGIRGPVLKVRLESATDLWRIDLVYLDCSPDAATRVEEISPVTAVDESGKDVAPVLKDHDGRYYATFKGQWADLTFQATASPPGMARSYVVKARGHYYQWMNAKGPSQSALRDSVLTTPLLGGRKTMAVWRAIRGQ